MFRPDLVLSGVKPYGLTILQASEHVAQPLTSITAKEVFVTGSVPEMAQHQLERADPQL
jgi:hypothetical protein